MDNLIQYIFDLYITEHITFYTRIYFVRHVHILFRYFIPPIDIQYNFIICEI